MAALLTTSKLYSLVYVKSASIDESRPSVKKKCVLVSRKMQKV